MRTGTEGMITTHGGSIPPPEGSGAAPGTPGRPGRWTRPAGGAAAEAVTEVVRRRGRGRPRHRLRRRDEQDELPRLHRRPADGVRAGAGERPERLADRRRRSLGRRVDSRRESRAFRRLHEPAAGDAAGLGPHGVRGSHRLQGPGAAGEGPRHLQGRASRSGASPTPSCPRSRRPWSDAARIAITRPRRPTVRHRRGDARRVPGDRRRRLLLQIDDPGLGETWDMLIPARRSRTTARPGAEPRCPRPALAGIPEERVRYHLCWGSWRGRTSTTSACGTSWTSCSASGPGPTRSRRPPHATPTSGACGGRHACPKARCSSPASSPAPPPWSSARDGRRAHVNFARPGRPRERHRRRRLRLRPGRAVPAPAPHDHVGQVRGARPGSAARLRAPVGVSERSSRVDIAAKPSPAALALTSIPTTECRNSLCVRCCCHMPGSRPRESRGRTRHRSRPPEQTR